MRTGDYVPLFSLIIALVLCIGTVVLVAFKRDIPPILVTGDGLAFAFVFGTSALRGTSPPDKEGKP
jgi:hypothetical protein